MNITIVAGARPNFMKIAPLIKAIDKHNSLPGTLNLESPPKRGFIIKRKN